MLFGVKSSRLFLNFYERGANMQNPVKGFERFNTVHDADDILNDVTIIEQSDMTVASSTSIVQRYVMDSNGKTNKYVYIGKILKKNAAGQTICIQTTYNGPDLPSWVPAGLIE
jgi:hypothetical protein